MPAALSKLLTQASGLAGDFNSTYSNTPPLKIVATTLAAAYIATYLRVVYDEGLVDTAEIIKKGVFYYLRKFAGGMLGYNKGLADARLGFLKDFATHQGEVEEVHMELPGEGVARKDVLALCEEHASINKDYGKGQYSGCIYHGGDNGYTEFINEAMAVHQWTNPLHAEQFRGVRKMETEIVSMVINMFNGTRECCGAMTSGGTESILLAMKAYRELGKIEKNITKPEIVVPITVHAAFDKAAHYFGLKIRHAKVDPTTGKVDMKHFKSLVNSNTVALVGSAYGFPHGIIDPIEEIAAYGKARSIPVHVDACLGGFILAFMEKAGYEVPEIFDFRNEGVTSISCDTHKYGFAPKGSSTILYRNKSYRKHQMHSVADWPGGIYASPIISGSRAGNIVAGTWAAMVSHGVDGYVQSAKEIVGAARFIAEEIIKIPGLKVMGNPLGSVVGFGSDEFDIYRLAAVLAEKGWELNVLQFPSSMHICCTRLHAVNDRENSKRLLDDIREGSAEIMKTKDLPSTGAAALYGTTQAIPDRSIIHDVAATYWDAYYDVDPKETLEAAKKEASE